MTTGQDLLPPEAPADAATERPAEGLDALFRPRAIALVGASDDPRKIGGRPLRYMRDAGSNVPMHPVNPVRDTVQGQQAFPSVAAIPGGVDQAILVVSADKAEAAVDDCLAAGVRSIIMFSAGFAEAGDEGRAAQARILDKVRTAGARMLGPNAMGLFNTADRVYSTFSSAMDRGTPVTGRVGMISQSGAVGSFLQNLAISRGLAISKFVATGNEADIEAADCIDWIAGDPDTDLLMVYLEGCRNGPKLISALARARSLGKPVIVLKAGKTEAGQSVAASHTGALAGSEQVFDAILRESGAYRAASLAEMVDVAYACACGRLPENDALAVITISGGVGVMATDAAMEAGLSMPQISEGALAQVRQSLPLATGLNPLDTTAQTISDRTVFTNALGIMLRDRPFGAAMLFLGNAGRNERDIEVLRGPLTAIRAEFPAMQLALCTQRVPGLAEKIEEMGFLIYEDPDACVRALAGSARVGANLRAEAVPRDLGGLAPCHFDGPPDEAQSKAALAAAGVRFAAERVAASAEEAVAQAEAIGFPVVLKVLSPDIAHKSEVGGVAVDLRDADAVRAAFARVTGNARAAMPGADLRGVTVAQMISGGVQTIIGAHRDPTFGPVVMFGLGGIYTEILKDTVLRPAPVGIDQARAMIREIRSFAILDGARGQAPADLEAIAETIVAVSRFIAAQGPEVESVEINPFIALPERGCGVDALIHLA